MKCKDCDREFSSKQALQYHQKKKVCFKEVDNVTTCGTCSRQFSSKQALRYHVEGRVCLKSKERRCADCNRLFSTPQMLQYHQENRVCLKDVCARCDEGLTDAWHQHRCRGNYDLDVVCEEHGDIAARCCPAETIRKLTLRKKEIDQRFTEFDRAEGTRWENAEYWSAPCDACGGLRKGDDHIWQCLCPQHRPRGFKEYLDRFDDWHAQNVEHARFLRQAKDSSCQILFVGDSLIRNMEETEEWDELFKPLRSLNFGIGGDCTEHVLWRMQNGELDALSPKVVVLLVGTNNHHSTADQIVEGIEAIVWTINEKLPSSKILVLGLLPRGEKPNPLREKHFQVNHSLSEIVTAIPHAQYYDADPGFVKGDGLIDHTDMFDYLHLTRKGYRKFTRKVYEIVNKLLKYN